MNAEIVFSSEYDLYLPLLNYFHPFDGRKYSRAYALLEEKVSNLRASTHRPTQVADRSDLLRVHSAGYIDSLTVGEVIEKALEIPGLRLVPGPMRKARILNPMLWAVQGTVYAAELAMANRREAKVPVFQLGGGFHHAFADRGEGFCLYADVGIAIASLRARKILSKTDRILVIDLDAHRGNGCEEIFGSDPSVQFFDMYNFQVYPGPLDSDEQEAPFLIPLKSGIEDVRYLDVLNSELPRFLEAFPDAKLAFYNAGSDIVSGDPLGHMNVSEAGVLRRDQIVMDALAARDTPTVFLTSGGYTARSHILIAQTIMSPVAAGGR